MDAACPRALKLQMLKVTTAVLWLGERVAAGDLSAAAEVDALAALLASAGQPVDAVAESDKEVDDDPDDDDHDYADAFADVAGVVERDCVMLVAVGL